MKKAYTALLTLIVSAILLIGCQKNSAGIQAVNLPEEEKQLLASVGLERYFVFDIDNIPQDIIRMDYSVEHYDSGKLVGQYLTTGQPAEIKKHRVTWSTIKIPMGNEEVWTLSFEGGTISQRVTLPENINATAWSQNTTSIEIKKGEEYVLAAIVGSETGAITSVAFINESKKIRDLESYDVAYLLKVKYY